MTVTVLRRPDARKALKDQENDAWVEYLDATRDQELPRYMEVEPWAWQRLNRRLLAIQGRRREIEEDDCA